MATVIIIRIPFHSLFLKIPINKIFCFQYLEKEKKIAGYLNSITLLKEFFFSSILPTKTNSPSSKFIHAIPLVMPIKNHLGAQTTKPRSIFINYYLYLSVPFDPGDTTSHFTPQKAPFSKRQTIFTFSNNNRGVVARSIQLIFEDAKIKGLDFRKAIMADLKGGIINYE